ncbi:MAG: 50S ribosomal protein L24 [Bacteroidetes bacterium]|nr:50S ribosomal protein L24 [Bacteroidota bacterium]MBP6315008.1 50S ribosomal protein L24 [Chitinophagaceae bacterium]
MKSRFKPKYSIKKGDQVVVISGADKDRKTPKTVLSVIPDENKPRVLVEGVNIKTRHLKPNAQNPQGSIVKQEGPIALSNVMLWDAKAGAATKVKRERKDGKAIRVSKKSGEVIK